MRVWGFVLLQTRCCGAAPGRRARFRRGNHRPRHSGCMPGASMSAGEDGWRWRLSAVTVVMMSAPCTAAATLAPPTTSTPHCAANGTEIALQLGGGGGIHIKQLQAAHAQQRDKGQRLKFALRAIANQRHAAAVPAAPAGAPPWPRWRRCAGGGQRQLAHKARRAGGYIGQGTKGHHRGQAVLGVDGVTVDVLKA